VQNENIENNYQYKLLNLCIKNGSLVENKESITLFFHNLLKEKEEDHRTELEKK